jgi:hypothetical protein
MNIYVDNVFHGNTHANTISANSFNVGIQTLEEYIQSVSGGGDGNVSNNYLTDTFVSNSFFQDNSGGDVSNSYITATFSSNNYIQDIFVSNTYLQAQGYGTGGGNVSNNYLTATFTSNNYLQGLGFTTNVGDVTNTYLTATFTSNNFVTTSFLRSETGYNIKIM